MQNNPININNIGKKPTPVSFTGKNTNVNKTVSPENVLQKFAKHGVQTGQYSVYFPNFSLKTDKDRAMYNAILQNINPAERKRLENLLLTGKLLNKNSDNGSSTLDSLYKIMTTPRVQGFDNKYILSLTIQRLENPFTVHQKFSRVHPEIAANIKNNPQFQPEPGSKMLPVEPTDEISEVHSGTCPAASREFNLADKKPAEFARYVEGLTSPQMEVKKVIDYKELSSSKIESIFLLEEFKANYKFLDKDTIELTLKPDKNAIVRAQLDMLNPEAMRRTPIDTLLQSTFMTMGSRGTYNSLTDERDTENTLDGRGLNTLEENYVASVVDEDGEKTSITYMNLDDDLKLKGYDYDYETCKRHLKDTIDMGTDVTIGMVKFESTDGSYSMAHITTITGYETNDKGELWFICQESDDEEVGETRRKATELIPTIHHAIIPHKVLTSQELDKLSPTPKHHLLDILEEIKAKKSNPVTQK